MRKWNNKKMTLKYINKKKERILLKIYIKKTNNCLNKSMSYFFNLLFYSQ